MFRLFFAFLLLCSSCNAIFAATNVAPSIAPQTTTVNAPLRVLHLPLWDMSLSEAKRWTHRARVAEYNTIVLMVWSGVKLNSAPWSTFNQPWSPKELAEWAAYAKCQGLDVVIEVKLLTHQDFYFQNTHPQLMFNSATYDPRNPDVYKAVFAVLDEVIQLTHPKAIQIGHDEVFGYNQSLVSNWLSMGVTMLPANLFLQDVVRLHDYLKLRNIETWMWGDMLISPAEFPTMNTVGLSGIEKGYGKALRQQLPRDIVICDWHYFPDSAYPSLDAFQIDGFRVIGATWENENGIRSFAQYAKTHNAYGMMDTIWYNARNVPKKVTRIMDVSQRAFHSK